MSMPIADRARAAAYRLPLPSRRRLLYLRHQRRFARLNAPRTFSEKVNWRIVHDRRPLIGRTCDKLAVKDEAARLGLRAPRTLWSGLDVRDLRRMSLPSRWVLKPNHRSGLVHFGGPSDDVESLAELTRGWLEPVEGELLGEWAYTQARRCLLVEEMLGDGTTVPPDYRFYVFSGSVFCIQVETARQTVHRRRFYTPDWEPLDVQARYPLADVQPPPGNLPQMMSAARQLGADFDFIRVDLYEVNGEVHLGELTPYPAGGLARIHPRSFDFELGDAWTLPDL